MAPPSRSPGSPAASPPQHTGAAPPRCAFCGGALSAARTCAACGRAQPAAAAPNDGSHIGGGRMLEEDFGSARVPDLVLERDAPQSQRQHAAPPPQAPSGSGPLGREIDDESFGASHGHMEIELDMPVAPRSRPGPPPQMAPEMPPQMQQYPAPPSSASGASGLGRQSQAPHQVQQQQPPPQQQQQQVAPPPRPPPAPVLPPLRFRLTPEQRAAFDLAEYGDPPAEIWGTPKYAVRVLYRKYELRQELEQVRHTSAERAKLYEAALTADDEGAVRRGVVLISAAVMFLFGLACIPVIVRFARLLMYG